MFAARVRRRLLLTALVVTAAWTAVSARAATIQVTIDQMTFNPPKLTVRIGDTIEWINKDVVDHTATEKASGLWNVSIAPGKTAKVVVKKAGRFDYYCRYHPNMTATLVVASAKK